MKRIRTLLSITAFSIFWFLVSPFPFENGGWSLFGGYKLLQPWITVDWMTRESVTNNAYYSSSIYPVILLCSSLLLGFISWRIVNLLRTKSSNM